MLDKCEKTGIINTFGTLRNCVKVARESLNLFV